MRSQQSQSSLNEEQRAVNSAVSDNCCVIAIPGSGKTHTVINKIVTILKGHEQRLWTSPHTVQAVTFTKSAAVELQQRAAKQLSSESQTRLRTGTFHSLFGNALKRSNSLLMTRKLAIDAVADGYLRRAIEECLSQYFSSRKPQDTEDIKTLILAARSKVEIPGGIQSLLVGSFFGIPAEAVNACLQSYRKNMARAKLRDHEMTLEEALLFLRSKGEIERTDQFLRRQNEFLKDTGFEMAWVDEWRNFIDFDHLFVDEAQDIDSVQLQIILEIANTGVVVDIVGDDDQSIYAFRHALGYSGMKEFVSKTGAREMLLQTNYRCKTEILRMADAIIQQNDPTNRKPKTLSGSRGGGGIVTLDMFKTQDFELHWTACAIGDLIKGTAQTSPKIAVLARVGSVLDLVERNLTTSGIKYTRIDDKSIWSEEPICFFLHLLARIADDNVESEVVWLESLGWIENPAERDAVAAQLRAVTTEARVICSDEYGVVRIVVLVHQWFLSAIHTMSKTSEKTREFLLRRLRIAGQVLIGNHEIARSEDEFFNSDVEILPDDKDEMGKGLLGSLKQRLRAIERVQEPPRIGKPTVSVMTMHGSKGQEFDHVWIVGVDDQILPGRKGAHQDAVLESRRLEEERRILYVAVTRAKDQLHISASEKTSYSAYSKDRTECRFLSALPFNLRPRQAYHGPAEPMRLTM